MADKELFDNNTRPKTVTDSTDRPVFVEGCVASLFIRGVMYTVKILTCHGSWRGNDNEVLESINPSRKTDINADPLVSGKLQHTAKQHTAFASLSANMANEASFWNINSREVIQFHVIMIYEFTGSYPKRNNITSILQTLQIIKSYCEIEIWILIVLNLYLLSLTKEIIW